ncbi:type IV pilus biogenesis/stability protein PilW [Rhodoferax aquaticus]|uniref:Type IV pilus biogenesis/stability protein PilW n=2 Tax=Rhodoferax aquaticus TaxID=2527691 RepID=A0A515EVR1_9BURK|nr:type IV pilus biogenesis/stability protein PilW [Rhodoferax aquaticus]
MRITGSRVSVSQRASCLLLVVCALFSAAACTSSPAVVPSAKADLVTESDEPESRTRARRHLTLAVLYFNDGKTTIALDALKQSITADPNWFEAYNLRGLIYMRLNDSVLAEDSFKRALALEPKSAAVQHNYGRLLCKQSKLTEASMMFRSALANPTYGDRAKTWMTLAECQLEAGQRKDAEVSFQKAFELDTANPFTVYNLALLMFQRGDYVRAQFFARRLNNGDFANAESLWLGVRVERKLGNSDAASQLAGQLKKRFSQSREYAAFEQGNFDE